MDENLKKYLKQKVVKKKDWKENMIQFKKTKK